MADAGILHSNYFILDNITQAADSMVVVAWLAEVGMFLKTYDLMIPTYRRK